MKFYLNRVCDERTFTENVKGRKKITYFGQQSIVPRLAPQILQLRLPPGQQVPQLGLFHQIPTLLRLLHHWRVLHAVVQKVRAQQRQANVLQNVLELLLPTLQVVRCPLLNGQKDGFFFVHAQVVV